jgi:oligopeptide/dipeptide ABC transporter ATP-binding protein
VETLLKVQNAKKYFYIPDGGLIRRRYKICKAVDDVSFSVKKGACFGIAGESGSGKTTIARLVLHIEKLTGGSILFEGKDLHGFRRQDTLNYHSQVQAVFQDAASSCNPRMRIRDIVSEPLIVQRHGKMSKYDIRIKTEEILHQVGLCSANLIKYPHELSGGQKQRVAIARAITLEPKLVILDEPVSALDVSIRAQILNLLADIQEREGLTYIIIAHDLAMMQHITTQIAIMYLGKIVEMGNTDQVFNQPMHPYTKALFSAIPRPEPGRARQAYKLSGEIGNPVDPPPGCRFHPRCEYAIADCMRTDPPLVEISPGHQAACVIL